MSDKIVAGIATGVMVAPLCALCAFGPAVVGSALSGMLGWVGNRGPIITVMLSVAIGFLIYRSVCRRHQQEIAPANPRRSVESKRIAIVRSETGNFRQTPSDR